MTIPSITLARSHRAYASRLLSSTLSVLAAATALSACATNPALRRARQISDADHDAQRALATENQLDPGKIPARSFAVTPFSVAERDTLLTPLGYGLADLLQVDLSRTPLLVMVDRMHIEAVLRETALVDSGYVDPRTGPRVGKLLGARRLLIGSVSHLGTGDEVLLQARVVDVIAGTVQDAVSARAPLSRILDAEKELAILLLERLGITLTPAERAQVELRQTTQLQALVAYGRGVEAESQGDAAGATAAFEQASHLDASFVAAQAQASGAPSSSAASSRASSLQRVLDLSAQGINQPIASRIPEAADAPLSASQIIALILNVRIF